MVQGRSQRLFVVTSQFRRVSRRLMPAVLVFCQACCTDNVRVRIPSTSSWYDVLSNASGQCMHVSVTRQLSDSASSNTDIRITSIDPSGIAGVPASLVTTVPIHMSAPGSVSVVTLSKGAKIQAQNSGLDATILVRIDDRFDCAIGTARNGM
jgi:hypothetical protein